MPYVPRLFDDGDVVENQVTLDLCGAEYPSEQRRSARHQVGIDDAASHFTGTSIEAVLYTSRMAAVQAMRELRAAKAACPTGYVPGDVAGEPPLRYQFHAAPDARWPTVPGVERFAVDDTINDQQGHTAREVTVYLRRGRLLVALYSDDLAITARMLTRSLPDFAAVLATRMTSLPSAPVDAP
jgi:hypothetical protein